MEIRPINKNINFNAKLKIKNPEKWNSAILDKILNNKNLKELAEKSDSDIIVYQSKRKASKSTGTHDKGEILFKYFIAKEKNNSLFNMLVRFMGFDKIPLSRNHHTFYTNIYDIIPNIDYSELIKKL